MAPVPAIQTQPAVEGHVNDDVTMKAALERITSGLANMKQDTPPTFMSLNEDIQRRILEFLLDAREVRVEGPNDQKPGTTYHFSVAILRSCKTIHALGSNVFNSNNFILASTTSTTLPEMITRQDVSMWTKKLQKFKGYVLRVHIIHKVTADSSKSAFFVLCAKEVCELVTSLRMVSYGGIAFPNQQTFKIRLTFQLHAATDGHYENLSTKAQRALLLPFAEMYGAIQQCAFGSSFDPTLTKTLETQMLASTHWSRAQCRHLLRFLLKAKKHGDKLLKHEYVHAANCAYLNAITLAAHSRGLTDIMKFSDDPLLGKAYRQVVFELQLGSDLCFLWMAHQSPTKQGLKLCVTDIFNNRQALGAQQEWPTTASKEQMALRAQIFALAHYINGNLHGCEKFLRIAKETLPGKYDSSKKEVQVMLYGSEDLSTKNQNRIRGFLFRHLPKHYPRKDIKEPVSTLAGLEQEVHALEKLLYTGDKLMGYVLQKEGWSLEGNEELHCPFDPAVINKEIGPQLEACAVADGNGVRRPDVVIGPTVRASLKAQEERLYAGHRAKEAIASSPETPISCMDNGVIAYRMDGDYSQEEMVELLGSVGMMPRRS